MSAKDNLPLHPAVLAPLPTVDGGFGFVMADPPWYYRSWTANINPESDRSVERHYRTMRMEEIVGMGEAVREVCAPDCHLALWITGPFLVRGDHATVMKAWGFKPSATFVIWTKLKRSVNGAQFQMISLNEIHKFLHFGLGHTTRKNVEFLMLGRRGNAKRVDKTVMEPLLSPVREHSRKPDEAFDRARRYAAGPYLELFSREPREGWTTWGNETEKFQGE